MSRFEKISTKELEKILNERIGLIKKIIDFIKAITQEIGEFEQRNRAHPNACILEGFEHFSFLSDMHQCDMGGNTFEVWYHPKEERINIHGSSPVLSVWYQTDVGDCEVRILDPSPDWQIALVDVIEHKDELLAKRKKAEEERKEKLHLQTEGERKRANLLVVAKRLKL
jgi:regulator of protease activity HflC (stomatin/prohibitin superfamily)